MKRWPGFATAADDAILAASVAFFVTSWRSDRIASLLFLTYAARVAFAAILNGRVLALN